MGTPMNSPEGLESDILQAKVATLPSTLILRGRTVLLKTPTPEDNAVMCQIFSDPTTMRHLPYFHRAGGWTLEEMAARTQRQLADQLQSKGLTLFIHTTKSNAVEDSLGVAEGLVLVGTTGFRSVDLSRVEAEIGIILDHRHWGKGLATESMYLCLQYAFEDLGLQKVYWHTGKHNASMRGWCENFIGMTPSQIDIETGEDFVSYTMLLFDWQQRVGQFLKQKLLL